MRLRIFIFTLLVLTGTISATPDWKVISSSASELTIDFTFSVRSGDDLEPLELLIGMPTSEFPEINASYRNKRTSDITPGENVSGVSWLRKQKLRGLNVAALQVSPQAETGYYYSNLRVVVKFAAAQSNHRLIAVSDQVLLRHRVINWNVAANWGIPSIQKLARQSQLPSGTWINFSVDSDGVKRIPYQSIAEKLADISSRDYRSYSLFSGSSHGRDYSKTLARINQPIPDNLVEIGIEIIDSNNDGDFNSGDEILFYGQGPDGFDVENNDVKYHKSVYYTSNNYWLLIPEDSSLRGKRISSNQSNTANPQLIDYGIAYSHNEFDNINPYETGNLWTGPQLANGATYLVAMDVYNPTTDITPQLTLSMLGSGSYSHRVNIHRQSVTVTPLFTFSWTSMSLRNVSFNFSSADLNAGANSFIIENTSSSQASTPYFNYLTLKYSRQLSFDQSNFDVFITPSGNPQRLNISASVKPLIWDITNPGTPKNLTLDTATGGYQADLPGSGDSTAHLVIFSISNSPQIQSVSIADDHDFTSLRDNRSGIDHIIIGPENYGEAMQPLVEHRGSSVFVPLEDVYRQFTAGNPDPLAIRMFVQWTQENWLDHPTYLFLVGDADHDYRNITGKSKIVVPTLFLPGGYEHYYSADDQLVTLYGQLPEIAIGRYPAQDISDAEAYVDKIIDFEKTPEPGLWRQRVTLVADDAARPEPEVNGGIQDAKDHTYHSETLVNYVSPAVTVQKIYMVEYPEVSDASSYGVVKPSATQALFDVVNRGTAIISYIGHGSPQLWAQERLLDQSRGDINSINTGGKLPIWIAATCSWGHFDDINNEAFSEELVREPGDGAIAVISTSRPIGAGSNFDHIKKIFQRLFPEQQVTGEPIGVVLQSVKTGSSSGKLFHLFGDPAMPLPIPNETLRIADLEPEILPTLETANFSGVQNTSTEGGVGYVMVKDADRNVTRQYYIASQLEDISYTLPGGTLFRGQFTVDDTAFSSQLRIPKDITYSDKPGKMTVYFQSGDEIPREALGYKNDIMFIGGDDVTDLTGPMITFETISGRVLQTGDHIEPSQGLVIRFSDPVGINIANEVGHGIVVKDLINDSERNLTNDFLFDQNSISTGKIDFTPYLTGLETELLVSAWDNANNPSERSIKLSFIDSQSLKLYHVLNFPNPFSTTTQFTFEITSPAEISIDIFTLEGRKIASIPNEYFTEGYHALDWDGRDEFGGRLANGVYLYRISAKNGDAKVTTIGKLAKYQ